MCPCRPLRCIMDRKITAVSGLPAVRLGLTYCVGCLAAAFSGDTLRIILLLGAAVLTCACFAMRRQKLAAAGLLLGLLSMSAYLRLYCQPLKDMSGNELRTSCHVISVSYTAGNYTVGRAWCILDGFPAVIDLTGNYAAQPGDVLDVTITLAHADDDMFTFSDGVVLKGGVQELHGTSGGFGLSAAAAVIRSAAASRLDILGGDEAALCKGLLLGNTSDFSMKLRRDITYSGANYMTAVSGAHITLVMMILMELFGKGKRSQAVTALITVPLLAVLFGFSPSVMRAGIMLLFGKCAVLFGRRAETMNSLCAAFLSLTLFTPFAAADPALLMSVLGTFGAAVLGRYVNRMRKFRFERSAILAKLKETAVISLCAMLCTAPVSISCFGGISLAAVAACVVLTPLFTAAIPLGLLYLITGFPLMSLPLLWVIKGFRALLGLFGGIPGVWLPADNAACVPLAFLAAALLIIGAFRRDWRRAALQSAALTAALFVCVGFYGNYTRSRIDLISDGSSGAAVICTRSEATVVISGTGSGLGKKLFNEFMYSGITRFSVIYAPELDYSGAAALAELAEIFPTDKLPEPNYDGESSSAGSVTVNGHTIACAKSGDVSVSADIVMYFGYTRGTPDNSAGLAAYASAWQNELPYNGVNIYDEPLRIIL